MTNTSRILLKRAFFPSCTAVHVNNLALVALGEKRQYVPSDSRGDSGPPCPAPPPWPLPRHCTPPPGRTSPPRTERTPERVFTQTRPGMKASCEGQRYPTSCDSAQICTRPVFQRNALLETTTHSPLLLPLLLLPSGAVGKYGLSQDLP